MEIIIVLIAFLATIIGSISGIGGGVIIKPVMDAISGLPMATISFLSGTTVLAMTIVSLLKSIKDPVKPEINLAIPLSIGAVFGGILGKTLFSFVQKAAGNNAGVGLVQNIVMVILTVTVFIYVVNKSRVKTLSVKNPLIRTFIGFFLGLASAFLGIGGGPINIMVLSFFFSQDSKKAAITSLFIIFCSQTANLITNIVSKSIPSFSVYLLIAMMVAAVVGATVGRMLNRKMDNKQVDKLFMGLMVVIILLSIYNAVKFGLAM
jgi:Predicted permeases